MDLRLLLRRCTSVVIGFVFLTNLTHAASLPVYYVEPKEDLRVKVLGGFIIIKRTFANGQWYPNYNWAPLKLTFDTFDNSVKAIARGKANYTKTAPGVFTYQKRNTIQQTPTGFRWTNRAGDWIEFDSLGDIQRYGNRNDVTVSFQYDTTASGKRITGVFDHFDRRILWYDYTGTLLTAIRDYTGRTVQYRYTGARLTSVIDVNGHTWQHGYTGDVPTIFTDPENCIITRTWTSNGELASLRYADDVGMDYLYEYDSSKGIYYIQEKTTGGRITETWLDAKGEIVRRDVSGKTIQTRSIDTAVRSRIETDPRGLKTASAYDQWDNETKITHPDGATVTTAYDPILSNITQKIDERGTTTKYEYDTKGNLIKRTEAVGLPEQRTTEYTYDQYGQRKTVRRLGDAVTQEVLTQYEYDSYGNLTTIINAEGHRTEYSDFDAIGNARTRKDARGKLWTKIYDSKGMLASEKDPLNNTTRYEYTKSGLISKIIDAVNNETIYSYDKRQNLMSITDPYGGVILYKYNNDNKQTKQIDQEGKIKLTEYSLDAQVIKQIDGNSNAIQIVYGDTSSNLGNLTIQIIYPTFSQEFKYDARGRLTEFTDVLDASTRFSTKITYDASGNRTSIIDKDNKITTSIYDSLNRIKAVTDSTGSTTEYIYDNRDNLIVLKDPKGNIYKFEYDRRNLKTKEIRPLGQEMTYTYTATANLETIVDAKGQFKKHTYDDSNRKTEDNYFLTIAEINPVKTVLYTYTDLNNLSKWSNGITQGFIHYDTKQLKKLGETVNYGPFSLSYSYSYYTNNLKKSFTGPDGVEVNYTYDANNQLSNIQLPVGNYTINQYQWFLPAQIIFPGGTIRTQSYNPFMLLETIQVKDPTQNPVMNYQYTYDKVNNILIKDTEHGTYIYGYDELYRLSTVNNPSPLENEIYTYDALGNRLADNNHLGTWQYNQNNQLLNAGPILFVYDNNGNAIKKTENGDNTYYSYDIDNLLVEVKDDSGGILARNHYDPFARRLWKEVNNRKTYFLYADQKLIAEASEQGNVLANYGYSPESVLGRDTIYLKTNNQYYFYQNDHLGTSQKLLSPDGVIVWSALSQAFGTKTEVISTVTNNLRFAGQYFDKETGLYYNSYRNYDPSLGRYVQSDPDGLNWHLNPYSYAHFNPLIYYDPTGKAATLSLCFGGPIGCAIGVTAAVGSLIWAQSRMPGVWQPQSPSDPLSSDAGIGATPSQPSETPSACGKNNSCALWPLDIGGEEWGRRNGVGAAEGRRRAHRIKSSDNMSAPARDYRVDPATGDVYDPDGEHVGNLNDVSS